MTARRTAPTSSQPGFPTSDGAGTFVSARESEAFSLQGLRNTLLRQRWLVMGITAVVVALVALLTWMQDPVYESSTNLRMDEPDQGQGLLGGGFASLGGLPAGGRLQTEMVVLRSRRIAESVADSLSLHVRLHEPAQPRDSVLRVLRAPRDLPKAVYVLGRQAGGTYRVDVEDGVRSPGIPATVNATAPFSLGDLTLALQPYVAGDPPEQLRIEVVPFNRAVQDLSEDLRVSRADPEAHVVRIGFRSTDPIFAAAVPNTVASSFLRYKTTATKSESRSTVNFLREQVAGYERQLEEAEGRLQSFREQQQVISITDQASEQVRQLAELQAERDQLQTERGALGQLLAQVQRNTRGPGQESPYRQLAAFPVFLSNRSVQDLLQSLTQLENQRAEYLVRRTEASVDVRGLTRRIEELETQLLQFARSYLNSLDSQIASADRRLASFGSRLESIPAREIEFARLSRQSELLEEIYTLLQTRLKEAEIQEAVEPSDIQVIDSALVPEDPVSPRPFRNLVLGGILGLMLGVGAAFGRQALDTKVRTREDAEQVSGGVPVLGMIPRIRVNGAERDKAGKRQIRRLSPEKLLEERLVVRREPRSPVAEAYRALRSSITFSGIESSPQVLVITSALPGDGKSTSAANLAITLAQQGTRVLLIDADLRKGLLHLVFDLPRDPGFTHVLLGKAALEQAVHEVAVPNAQEGLHFLPTGVFPPNPSELLGSKTMATLLEQIRGRYDMIILDAPPINLVTDAGLLGRMADATVLVTRSGTTDKGALHHAVVQLRHLRVPVSGIILNDLDAAELRYYGGGYYGYGSEEPSHGRNGAAV